MRIDFESKPVYGDDDKYMKTKIKIYAQIQLQIFIIKKCLKKNHNVNGINNTQILLLKQIRSIILKYFQKNANMYKKR